ncbi:hypothetical protein IMSAG185_01408 [Lachnospiraceae bacterium]|nr:hypothetical protein IMSAG185_01408 [Lachnospiraceae bacterium]
MKNIFVEGIQGMGKSTLVNSISAAVPELVVCREGDYSPVDLAWCTWMSREEYEDVLKRYQAVREEIIKNTVQEREHFVIAYTKIITDIPHFHKDLEQYEVYNARKTFQELKELILTRYRNFSRTGYLFECSFFQNIIEDFILFHLLSDDEIVNFYGELYRYIDQEQFFLLYLYSDNLAENIEAIRKERCDQQGNELWYQMMWEYFKHSPYGKKHGCSTFDDLTAHFRHRQGLEMRIIREVLGDRAAVVPAKAWKTDEILSLIK